MTTMGLLRNPLVEQDYKGNAIPELAESWEASEGAKRWVFKLRKGVEFHNGKSFDADDVIYSIFHHTRPEAKGILKSTLKQVKDIKKDDKHTVIFDLEAGNADFPYILASTRAAMMPNGTTNYNEGIGTGGYKLVEFEPGVRLFAKRNPNYWKTGRAHFDEVEITSIADTTARTTALKTGKIDVVNRPDRKTAHLLAKAPGIQLVNVPGALLYTFPMLADTPPYDNNDVRMGLKYSVDREHLVKTILRGYGRVGNDQPIASVVKYHASEMPQRQYDPDKAKYHLKKAGALDSTFKLHVADAAFAGAVDTAQLWQQHAEKAGIKIEVIKEPSDGYWKTVWKQKPFSACFWFGRATADWMFSVCYAADAPQNDMNWKHPRFNELLNAARAELDQEKRKAMYIEMQEIVHNEGSVIIPMIANMVDAASNKLKFENPAGNWELDGMRLCERWWFA
jgi:peptide/nickel transport system substrate-binding protein